MQIPLSSHVLTWVLSLPGDMSSGTTWKFMYMRFLVCTGVYGGEGGGAGPSRRDERRVADAAACAAVSQPVRAVTIVTV